MGLNAGSPEKETSTEEDLKEAVDDILACETVTTRKLQVRCWNQTSELIWCRLFLPGLLTSVPRTMFTGIQALYEAFSGKDQSEECRLLSVRATRHLLRTQAQHTADKVSALIAPSADS